MNQNTNVTWIKLYRKLKEHDIMRDPTALQIFIWILISVDYKTGKMISGRFWASQELKINPRTFHKALTERLQNRFNLVTLTSDNKKTTISVNNWDKYQVLSDSSGDSSVTTKGQQSDTIQEYKKKRNNNIYSSIKSLTDDVLSEIAEKHSVNKNDVIAIKQKMENWLQAKGKRYKNYKAGLSNWILKSIEDGRIKKINKQGGRLASMIDERKNAQSR